MSERSVELITYESSSVSQRYEGGGAARERVACSPNYNYTLTNAP